MTFGIRTFNQISEIQKNANIDDYSQYLLKILLAIKSDILGLLSHNYQYYSMIYYRVPINEVDMETLSFSEISHDTEIIKVIGRAKKLSETDAKISLAHRILGKKLPSLMLHNGHRKRYPYLKEVMQINLSKIPTEPQALATYKKQPNAETAAFMQRAEIETLGEKEGFWAMLGLYKGLLEQYPTSVIYFMRSLRDDFQYYNGVILLIVKRPLREHEFVGLSYMLSFILASEAQKKMKEEQWRIIADEQSHAFRHDMGAVQTDLRNLKVYFNQYNEDKFNHCQSQAVKKVAYLTDINEFLLLLMQAGDGGEYFSNLDESTKKTLATDAVSLKEVLHSCLDTLAGSMEALDITTTAHRLLITNQLMPVLRLNINALPDVKVGVIPVAFRIVLLDLMKNALFYSSREAPSVKIEIREDSVNNYLTLRFQNNTRISDAGYQFIKYRKEVENFSKRQKGGIRTIFRLLDFPYFGKSKMKWQLDVAESSLTGNWTDIFLKIPQADKIT